MRSTLHPSARAKLEMRWERAVANPVAWHLDLMRRASNATGRNWAEDDVRIAWGINPANRPQDQS